MAKLFAGYKCILNRRALAGKFASVDIRFFCRTIQSSGIILNGLDNLLKFWKSLTIEFPNSLHNSRNFIEFALDLNVSNTLLLRKGTKKL